MSPLGSLCGVASVVIGCALAPLGCANDVVLGEQLATGTPSEVPTNATTGVSSGDRASTEPPPWNDGTHTDPFTHEFPPRDAGPWFPNENDGGRPRRPRPGLPPPDPSSQHLPDPEPSRALPFEQPTTETPPGGF